MEASASKYNVPLVTPFRRPTGEQVTATTKGVRFAFGWLGLGAGVAAGIYTHDRWGSVWLSIFVGLLALQLVGRALPDLITDSKKIRRGAFFLVAPGVAAGSFYLAYQAWEIWWLAFLLGLVGGWILGSILGRILFPGIYREEVADTTSRFRQARA